MVNHPSVIIIIIIMVVFGKGEADVREGNILHPLRRGDGDAQAE